MPSIPTYGVSTSNKGPEWDKFQWHFATVRNFPSHFGRSNVCKGNFDSSSFSDHSFFAAGLDCFVTVRSSLWACTAADCAFCIGDLLVGFVRISFGCIIQNGNSWNWQAIRNLLQMMLRESIMKIRMNKGMLTYQHGSLKLILSDVFCTPNCNSNSIVCCKRVSVNSKRNLKGKEFCI